MKHSLRAVTTRTVGLCSLLVLFSLSSFNSFAQDNSVAREWNEVVLEAIRNDFARPTVHSRNLFHSSILLYDSWAIYDDEADTYFLGKTLGEFECIFDGISEPENIQDAQEEAMSYAAYRLILYRFADSPLSGETVFYANQLMQNLGFITSVVSTDYSDGNPAHLGNYLAEQMIAYGDTDGSNESDDYGNLVYETVNEPLNMSDLGNPLMTDPNRWQQLTIEGAIDQSGNAVESTLPFLGPEWGNVAPFAMTEEDVTIVERDGINWKVYHDPGMPPLLELGSGEGLESNWKWGHVMVSVWQSHHDSNDETLVDISPASLGNNPVLPASFDDYDTFYNFSEGGDQSQGYAINPATGAPYAEQLVKRADYARVLAEFWADGPDSETPPGHWFKILNTVSEHPLLEKRWNGQGPVLSDLEWDVKTYFTLGGGMHDSAISAWSVKGLYDYSRPVSAIRYMAEKGQCSDEALPNFHPDGLPLLAGFVEMVELGDPLAGENDEFVGEVKLYTWKGPDYINNPFLDEAGVDWILAKKFFPYQRATFVTPPFAGYVSGHSTFSRCAAELMTLMTGDAFFPGGMSEFLAEQNQFLVFEQGPSTDILLEWATYRDASDQCSLSRIWGGIHPPADDIPGRMIGMELGPEVFTFAESYFSTNAPRVDVVTSSIDVINDDDDESTLVLNVIYEEEMNQAIEPQIAYTFDDPTENSLTLVSSEWIDGMNYQITYSIADVNETFYQVFLQVSGAEDIDGFVQSTYIEDYVFALDTENPSSTPTVEAALANDETAVNGTFGISIVYNENMLQTTEPIIMLVGADIEGSLVLNETLSEWTDGENYNAVFDVIDANAEIVDVAVDISGAVDQAGNLQVPILLENAFTVDTQNPQSTTTVLANITDFNTGPVYEITLEFSEPMDPSFIPSITFSGDDPLLNTMTAIDEIGTWINETSFVAGFNTVDANETLTGIEVDISNAFDMNENPMNDFSSNDLFIVDTENPMVTVFDLEDTAISDVDAGPYSITVSFSEPMDTSVDPDLIFTGEDISGTLVPTADSEWLNDLTYEAVFNVIDENIELNGIGVNILNSIDANGNLQMGYTDENVLTIDTKNPTAILVNANDYEITFNDDGPENFSITTIFDEPMNTSQAPFVLFPDENPLSTITESLASGWINNTTYQKVYNVSNATTVLLPDVDVVITGSVDLAGNLQTQIALDDYFDIDVTPVGVDEVKTFVSSIYPNPVNAGDPLKLKFAVSMSNIQLDVVSINGQLIKTVSVPSSSEIFELNTTDLSAGMYLIKVSADQGQQTLRVQVLR
jgi:hypothetical protein